ncbi:MAG TPA: Na+/H+ antiporter subunit B [Gemmatimonadaceae bacterium]|nr:Na+/H+ antiporter subunit B [Gemmatimonadaceae bacterium]
MNSLVLQTATRFLITLLLLFSVFLLFRGHNYPGGGFIGGLIGAGAFALYAIAFGVRPTRRALRLSPRTLIAAGLGIAVASGLPAVLFGLPFLTGAWTEVHLGRHSMHIGTPLIFDVGVYLVVIGVTLSITLSLEEE